MRHKSRVAKHVIVVSHLVICARDHHKTFPMVFDCCEISSPGEVLLVTDDLASPADFLLQRFVANGFDCVAVVLSEDVGRWKAINAKYVRLFENKTCPPPSSCPHSRFQVSRNGSLALVDIAEPEEEEEAPTRSANRSDWESHLCQVYERVRANVQVEHRTERKVVLVDDLARLAWIGCGISELKRFLRALAFFCRDVREYHFSQILFACDILLRNRLIYGSSFNTTSYHPLSLTNCFDIFFSCVLITSK
jgi:hypothetical protein